MKKMLILHGIGGNPTLNWYQYIVDKVKTQGYSAWVPQLPNSNKPNLLITNEFIKKNFVFDKDTILVGHSSGASLALGILQLLPMDVCIRKTILVSGFTDPYLTPELHKHIPRSDYDDLFPDRWDWEKIKATSKKFIIFHSPSDPFVQLRHPETLQAKLHGELILIPNASHFSVTAGGDRFKQFPELLEKIFE